MVPDKAQVRCPSCLCGQHSGCPRLCMWCLCRTTKTTCYRPPCLALSSPSAAAVETRCGQHLDEHYLHLVVLAAVALHDHSLCSLDLFISSSVCYQGGGWPGGGGLGSNEDANASVCPKDRKGTYVYNTPPPAAKAHFLLPLAVVGCFQVKAVQVKVNDNSWRTMLLFSLNSDYSGKSAGASAAWHMRVLVCACDSAAFSCSADSTATEDSG